MWIGINFGRAFRCFKKKACGIRHKGSVPGIGEELEQAEALPQGNRASDAAAPASSPDPPSAGQHQSHAPRGVAETPRKVAGVLAFEGYPRARTLGAATATAKATAAAAKATAKAATTTGDR